MTSAAPTPGQTVGPFFHYALPYAGDRDLVPPGTPGAIRLHGRVTDGAGAPVPDALLEIWQADPSGAVPRAEGSLRRDGFTFTGFGRASTDRRGVYSFSTLTPGPTRPGAAPFFAVTVFARGQLDRLLTRAYLPAGSPGVDEQTLDVDRLLASLPAERRSTLVATADGRGYVFDVRLQGDDETVFLAFDGRGASAGGD
ncbi:protocatechuate 3,4-dioxygenase alpha subunit [Nocardioides zeae]|uniref:Protocatechuate 3,4-dioxygenase alpha subunit n=1 Tax=Nocardioides zeae TaxID=1457234 RepID=A0ACC6IF81_9ACTN|nr:protocatechuate 3,4-dioxygenase subunit alpha [Nocardioides zeae]MDR6174887.1 protocatechuate 3,4-dioxygenase alpha subunit [Nocardioides zeae]MDR6209303.1 protocatechuate 3,4-dioxygenase alpha subunit [Nocardioides zeae]